jgi:hypothetical protein
MQLLGNCYDPLVNAYYIEDDELEKLLKSMYKSLLQKKGANI